jgi:nucleoside-diphosphate-sugar epimerase
LLPEHELSTFGKKRIMQTILGAGGAIGVPLALELNSYTSDIRLVGRNPRKVNPGDQLFTANMLQKAEVVKAVEGSEVCYLTIGLEYKATVWEAMWPTVMKNVLEACQTHQSKLVFFDNIYALAETEVGHITEQSKMNATSRKGKVRQQIDQLLLEAVEKGKINASIARAPDFYGPIKEKSVVMSMIYDNLTKGKKANWLCKSDMPHSSGYAPELAKGTAMLGNTADTFNQIWNLPVDSQVPTAIQWAEMFRAALKKGPEGVMSLPPLGIKLLGVFIPVVGEMYEMRYQYDRPYFFDSSKFNSRFNYTPIANQKAVQETVEKLA